MKSDLRDKIDDISTSNPQHIPGALSNPQDIDDDSRIQVYQLKIQSHFQRELETKKRIYEEEEKIQEIGFALFRAIEKFMRADKDAGDYLRVK